LPGNQSAGLELVDVALWIAKRFLEERALSDELRALFSVLAKRGRTDEVSFAGLDNRWRHLVHLPEPKGPLPTQLIQLLEQQEAARLQALAGL